MSLRRVLCYLLATCLSGAFCLQTWSEEVSSKTCANDLESAAASTPSLVVRAERMPPATTTNIKLVTVCSLNVFRYDVHIQSQSSVSNPPTPLTALVPAVATFQPVVRQPAATASNTSRETSPPDPYKILKEAVDEAKKDSQAQLYAFTDAQNDAAQKLACYTDLARLFPSLLLTESQKTALKNRLKGNGGTACSSLKPAWDTAFMAAVEQQVLKAMALNTRIAVFQASSDYQAWLKTGDADTRKSLYASLYTDNAATITQLQGILASPNVATYNATMKTISDWDARSTYALDTSAPWDQSLSLPCRAQWFGKTDGQMVTLQYIDLTQAAPTAQSSPLFTNTCLPSLTVSTGLGLSTVRNSTYAFVPQTDYTRTPPVTTQTIGYASDARIVPLYVGQMNYGYFQRSIGLHVSAGAGVSSVSSGTTGDFLAGNAISFFHRAVFVTPAYHLTQRQKLMSGYAVGDLQGSLTSVPTITGWKGGFAISITLPVLQ